MTTPTTVSVRLQLRADTAANWTSANPTLLANELGRETDTGKIKIGDGSTAWSSLAYQAWATLPIAVASGGTGQTSYTNGQLLIGNTTGNTLTKATLTAGSGIAITNGTGSITVAASGISDAQIAADAEIVVSKLADGSARQLLQTDAAGTGVEWASNIDIPGTLDVTSAATFDSTIGASAGTASLPSITFTGDLNTGIYSPGADQVAVATNGTGRIFINSLGQLGVGRTPTAAFDVYGSNPTIFVESSTGTSGNIRFINTSGSMSVGLTGAGGNTYLIYDNANSLLAYQYAGAASAGVHTWYTAGTERLRITSAGLVGVGTSSPGGNLDVRGLSGTTIIRAVGADTNGNADTEIFSTGTTGNSRLYFSDTAAQSGSIIYSHANNSFAFSTGGVSAVTIDSSQRVGIGTTSPSYLLDVSGSARIKTGATGTPFVISTGGDSQGSLRFGSSGNLYGIYGGPDYLSLQFHSQGAEAARIDSSGRLLVGTSSARGNFYNSSSLNTPQLQVEGINYSTSSLSMVCNNTGTTTFPMLVLAKSAGASIGSNTAVSDNHILGQVTFQGNDGTEFIDGANITAVVDGVSGADDLPTRLMFSTTADGASSPTERMRIDSAGQTRFLCASGNNVSYFVSADGAGTAYRLIWGGHSATSITSGTNSFVVWTNGNVQNTNGSYTTLSDAKLKENIVDAGSQWDDLKAIKIRKWNFKAETGHETHRQIGPIAQELEQVCPGLVFETPDQDAEGNDLGTATKGVNQSVLYMKAVKALQEAMERIEQLEAEMAEVKAQLA